MRRPLAPVLFDLAAGRPLRQRDFSADTCRQAAEHKMGGLLVTRMREGEAHVPAEWMRALESRDAMYRLWHAKQLTAVSEVSRVLNELDLPHLFIKGVTTTERWYSRLGERMSADVDVVLSPLRPDLWQDAIGILMPDHPAVTYRADPESLLNDLALKLPLAGGIDLDVHFDIIKYGLPAVLSNELWGRRQSLTLSSGEEVNVLDPEVAIVQALIELNRDGFRYLKGFADVTRILGAEEIDWAYIDDLVTREGIREPTFLSLKAVVDTLDLPHPLPINLTGWRIQLWNLAWPVGHRLQGDAGALKWRHRERLLAFFPNGRRRAAAKRWLEYFFPPRWRLEALYPDVHGPYLWRNVWPRIKRMRLRRAARSRIERGDRDSAESNAAR